MCTTGVSPVLAIDFASVTSNKKLNAAFSLLTT
jgi:hypothetical protein